MRAKKIVISVMIGVIAVFGCSCGNNTVENGTMRSEQEKKESKENKSGGEINKEVLLSHEETSVEDFDYFHDDDSGIEIDGYNGTDEIIVIPEEIDGQPVVKINKGAFTNNTSIKAVKIADSVKEIDEMAIGGCSNLEIVVCGKELETIGRAAFQLCDSLMEIELNDGIKYIKELAFSGCDKLKTIYIPDSVEEIDSIAFFSMNEDFTILGKSGSVAETYAQSEGIKFEAQ